jgi:hypothetical protein
MEVRRRRKKVQVPRYHDKEETGRMMMRRKELWMSVSNEVGEGRRSDAGKRRV